MGDLNIKVRLTEDNFRKFKVFCAIKNVSMCQEINHIVKKYVDEQSETIKIVNIKKEK